jgi:NitT/TauT family transport system permease protein
MDAIYKRFSFDYKAALKWLVALAALVWLSYMVSFALKFIPPEAGTLPRDILLSTARVAAAYLLSLIFALAMGFAAASRKRAEKILLPTMDILQSVPVVGFFPVAIAFFVALFQGERVGIELAAIFLIFTSQAWNMAFGVYESLITIPKDLRRAAAAYNLKGWLAFKRFYLPACVPSLTYNSMVSWANGWFFLVSSEIFAIGARQYHLPGLGSFLWFSSEKGRLDLTLAGLIALVTLIITLNVFVWRPLTDWSRKFSYQMVPLGETRPVSPVLSKVKDVLLFLRVQAAWGSILAFLHSLASSLKRWSMPQNLFNVVMKFLKVLMALFFTLAIVAFLVWLYSILPLLLNRPFPSEAALIPLAVIVSFLRLFITYLICLLVAVPLALLVVLKEKIGKVVLPLTQVLASLPGTALYPVILALVLRSHLSFGLDLVSITIIFTTSVWYIFFPLTGLLKNIPRELKESVLSLSPSTWFYIKKLLIPGAFPALITGSLAAWGGGWNALVVSEYGVFNQQAYKVFGIGSLIDIAAYQKGDPILLFLCLAALVFTVIMLNRLVWQKLYRLASERFSLEIS